MSIFVPFKAFRPTKGNAKAVASKPYDVLNEKKPKLNRKVIRFHFITSSNLKLIFREISIITLRKFTRRGKKILTIWSKMAL